MATDANMMVNDYGFDDDDDDYYSCVSEMAPIASSENIFGIRTNLESGQFFDCKLVSAKFDQDEKRFSQEPGITNVLDLEEDEVLSINLLPDDDNSGHGTYVEDIPLPSEKESTGGDLLTRVRRSFELLVSGDEILSGYAKVNFVDVSDPDSTEMLAISSIHVPPSGIPESDKDVLTSWKCQRYFDSMEFFHEESDDERTSDFDETFPKAATYPRHLGLEFWKNYTSASNNEQHYIHSEFVSDNAKRIVTSDYDIAENNITGPEHEMYVQQYVEVPAEAIDLTQTHAVTDLGKSPPELTEVLKSEEDKVSPTSVVIGRFLVRTVSENVLCQPLQKETVLKPGTSDNSGLDYLRDDSGIDALDKPPVERIPESGTGNEDNSSTEKATKKKGFFRSLFSCICPRMRKKNPKMKTSDKVAKKITCSENSEIINSKV